MKKFGYDSERISRALMGIAQKTAEFSAGTLSGFGSAFSEDLESIKDLPGVFEALAGMSWRAVKNPSRTIDSIMKMAETFDSQKFMSTVGSFFDTKLTEFNTSPPHKRGVMLGRLVKEVLTFALPAGAGYKAISYMAKAGKRAKMLRTVGRIAKVGKKVGNDVLAGVVQQVTRINGVTLKATNRIIHSAMTGSMKVEGSTVKLLGKVNDLYRLRNNPLTNTKYTSKVMSQMRQGDYHAFPKKVDNWAGVGKRKKITGGDGTVRTKIELQGSYRGINGHFEWILEPNGTVNHRLFVPKR